MTTSEMINDAERRLRSLARTPTSAEDSPSLRLAVHRLRPTISELRRSAPGRPQLQWATIAVVIAESLGLPASDPKMLGRVVCEYHHQKLSKTAAALSSACAKTDNPPPRSHRHADVETPGVRRPTVPNAFLLDE